MNLKAFEYYNHLGGYSPFYLTDINDPQLFKSIELFSHFSKSVLSVDWM